MDNGIILITVTNKYGNYVNVNNPKIVPLYEYFKKRVKSARWPICDEQRYYFEKIIVNLCRRGIIRVPDWVIHSNRVNAWNRPKWLEYKDDIIHVDNGYGVLYGDMRDELTLIYKSLFWRFDVHNVSSDDFEVVERIELIDPVLARKISERLEGRKNA